LQDPVDVIFSNAVFHWIDAEKQNALAAHIASALKPGGTLVCEFGGKNCAESVHAVLEQCFTARGLHYPRINYFPTIAEYTAILERNGLRPDYAVLFDRPTPQSPGKTVVDWIEMFVGEPFRGMEETQKAEILQETENRLRPKLCNDGKWIIDYVRIRVRARKI
jgi:trans-aconitate methyltransferase